MERPAYSAAISPLDDGCFEKVKKIPRALRRRNWDEFKKVLIEVAYDLNDHRAICTIEDPRQRWEKLNQGTTCKRQQPIVENE